MDLCRSGDAGRVLCLMAGFVVPNVSRPGVLGDGGEEDNGGLIVDPPGGEALGLCCVGRSGGMVERLPVGVSDGERQFYEGLR